MARRRGYGQFCPVAKASEIVAERWTPLILRELVAGTRRFSDIQRGVPLCSPSLLSTRLKELEAVGVVARHTTGRSPEYALTAAGEELRPIIELLGRWGHRHAQKEVHRDDLDPSLLMWDIRRRADASVLPAARRTVVRFDLSGAPAAARRWWLVFDRGDVDLCLTDPGHDADLTVTSTLRVLTEIWTGHRPLRPAIASGLLRLDGDRAAVRSFPRWFRLSMFAR